MMILRSRLKEDSSFCADSAKTGMLHVAKTKSLAAIYTESWRPPVESILNETLSCRLLFPSVSDPSLLARAFGYLQ